jgi:hypothetical protein
MGIVSFFHGVTLSALALSNGVWSTPLSNVYEKRTTYEDAVTGKDGSASKARFLSSATTSELIDE